MSKLGILSLSFIFLSTLGLLIFAFESMFGFILDTVILGCLK